MSTSPTSDVSPEQAIQDLAMDEALERPKDLFSHNVEIEIGARNDTGGMVQVVAHGIMVNEGCRAVVPEFSEP